MRHPGAVTARFLATGAAVALTAAIVGPLFFIPWRIVAPMAVPAEVWITCALWAFAVLAAASRAAAGSAPWVRPGTTLIAALGFVAWVLAQGLGAEEDAHRQYAMSVLTYVLGAYAIVAWLDVRTDRRRDWLLGMCLVVVAVQLMAGFLVVAGIESSGLFPSESPVWGYFTMLDVAARTRQPIGTLGNPNYLSELLVLLVPVVAGWLVTRGARSRAVASVVLVLSAAMLIIAASRAALAGAVVAMAVAAFVIGVPPALRALVATRRARFVTAASLALLATVAALAIAFGRLGTKLSLDDLLTRSGASRVTLWRVAVALWRERPWTGVGLGGYQVRVTEALANVPAVQRPAVLTAATPEAAHSELLQLLAETGLVGAALVVATTVLWYRAVRRNESLPLPLRWGVTAGTTGLLFTSFFGFPLHIPVTALAFVVVLALGLAGPGMSPSSSAASSLSSRWYVSGPFLAALAALGAIAVLQFAWPLYQSARLRYRGEEREYAGDFQSAQTLYRMAAERARFSGATRFLQMRALAKQRLYDDALRIYDHHWRDGMPMEAALLRAHLLSRVGRTAEARELYRRVLAFYPPSDPLHARAADMARRLPPDQ